MKDYSRKFISAFCKPSTMCKEMASYQSPREKDWLVPQSFYLTIFKLDPPPLSEHLELVPTVPQSFYLTIFKLNPSLTVPFKSKLTVRCESQFLTWFAILDSCANQESRTSYQESSRGSSLTNRKQKIHPWLIFL